MFRRSFLIVPCLLCSCISFGHKDADLLSEYHAYIRKLNEMAYTEATAMLSTRYQHLLLSNNKAIQDHYISSLDEEIETEVAVYQKIEDHDTGCLTLNGFKSSGKPMTMSITFVREKGGWKIDYPHLMFWDEAAEFPKEATCPATDYGE